ncbi:MAG: hypothetical protein MZV63_58300 [Marinilabiliales bacterium]|nr:hypothetical protein [Marinilabiliales bacterium]
MVNEVPLNGNYSQGIQRRSGREKKHELERTTSRPPCFMLSALDGGDPSKQTEFRDELFSWEAPFSGEPVSMAKNETAVTPVLYGGMTRRLFSPTAGVKPG